MEKPVTEDGNEKVGAWGVQGAEKRKREATGEGNYSRISPGQLVKAGITNIENKKAPVKGI